MIDSVVSRPLQHVESIHQAGADAWGSAFGAIGYGMSRPRGCQLPRRYDDFAVWRAYLHQMMAFCPMQGIFKWKLDGYPDLCQIWEESHYPSHPSALFGPGDFEI